MIINYWQLSLFYVITICVLAFPENGFAVETEQTPPFLLIDSPTPEETTETTNSTTDNPPSSRVTDADKSTNLEPWDIPDDDTEQTPPFLLIDSPTPEESTETTNSTTDNPPSSRVTDADKSTNLEPWDIPDDDTEQTPPFLLIDSPTPEESTETTNSTTDNPPSSRVTDADKSTNLEPWDIPDDETEADDLYEDIQVYTSIAEPPFFSFLDDHQKLISNYLHKTVIGVDTFFAKKQSIDQSTGSHLRISLETLWPEGQGASFKGSISLRARLPGIKEKYRLVVESDPVEQRELVDLETRSTDQNATQNDGLYTGLQKNVNFFGWKARPSLGVKIRSPLDYYARLRIDRSDFFKRWALYLNESLYWFDSSGFGFDSTMRWDRPLNYMFLFRTTSLIRYTDSTDIYDLSQTAEIVQTLSRKRAITYKIGMFGNSENRLHATDYLVNLLYRQNIHSDYLFLDLQPQILFNKENNFEAQHEFLMRLEIFYRD